MILRLLKRAASVEIEDLAEFVRVELHDRSDKPDWRLSVYQLPDAKYTTQARAEHNAGADLKPAFRSAKHVDVPHEGHHLEQSPGNQWFKFTQNSHNELILKDEQEFGALARTIFAQARQAAGEVLGADLKTYVAKKKQSECPEWCNFFRQAKHGAEWERKCG